MPAPEALQLLRQGQACLNHRRWSEALACFQALLRWQDSALVHNHLALAYKGLQNYPQALVHAHQALQQDPASVSAWANLGNLQRELQQPAAALQSYEQALARCPKTSPASPQVAALHFNRALALLMLGQDAAGFEAWLWKRQTLDEPPAPAVTVPLWQGEPLAGKALWVQASEGYGDTLQLLRLLPQLATQAAAVSLQCQPALLPLLQPWAEQIAGLQVQESAPPAEVLTADYWTQLYTLPHFCGLRLAQLPGPSPYLQAPPRPAVAAAWAAEPTDLPRIGLVWACQPQAPSASRRSCPLADLLPLLAWPAARFYALQTGPAAAQIESLPANASLQPCPVALPDFAVSAAVLMQLELLITVDTAMAHLAGALGRPVWVLLPYGADWRWLLQREDSPWYPSMRLFRQREPGDWTELVQRVQGALQTRMAHPDASQTES